MIELTTNYIVSPFIVGPRFTPNYISINSICLQLMFDIKCSCMTPESNTDGKQRQSVMLALFFSVLIVKTTLNLAEVKHNTSARC